VVIVDDDSDFVEVIQDILEAEDSWEVVNTFNSLESFLSWCGTNIHNQQIVCPDILLIDLFASNKPPDTPFPLTGFHVALALRAEGLKIGTVIASSMSSTTMIALAQEQYPGGWSFLTKSSNLESREIIKALHMALLP